MAEAYRPDLPSPTGVNFVFSLTTCCVARPQEATLNFLHKIKGSSIAIENCLTKRITGLSLLESETLLANFATNSVVSIHVFLANIAPGRWPDQNMENIKKVTELLTPGRWPKAKYEK